MSLVDFSCAASTKMDIKARMILLVKDAHIERQTVPVGYAGASQRFLPEDVHQYSVARMTYRPSFLD
jgi:hypothetical protein